MFLGYTNPHVQELPILETLRPREGRQGNELDAFLETVSVFLVDMALIHGIHGISQNVTVRNRWESRIRRCIYFGFKWSVCEGRLRMIVDGSK